MPLFSEAGLPASFVALSFADWQSRPEWPAVSLSNTDPVEDLAPHVARLRLIVLNFPKFSDGRAYSQARLLRGRWRWRGQIRAVGDVIPDMAPLLWRSGFDTAVLRPGESTAVAQQALQAFDGHYQPDTRRTRTAPERAHG